MSSTGGEQGEFSAAQLRVVRGEPDDHELAALVAGIVAAGAGQDDEDEESTGPAPWAEPARRLGVRSPGPHTWRWSLHP
ncbi:MAG TPA: acyl-CoA carboxylase subunit epsilon [Actinomycetaceae bacterium]|nr:acyl-CoA carboxylase subunit epsilon [Actinomycetaceae bacterium]